MKPGQTQGIDPDEYLHASDLLRARDIAIWRAEDNLTLSEIHASVKPPRLPNAGGSQAYSKPTPQKGGRSVAIDPNRHPRSLAAADRPASEWS